MHCFPDIFIKQIKVCFGKADWMDLLSCSVHPNVGLIAHAAACLFIFFVGGETSMTYY